MHLVGFTVEIGDDARPYEDQICFNCLLFSQAVLKILSLFRASENLLPLLLCLCVCGRKFIIHSSLGRFYKVSETCSCKYFFVNGFFLTVLLRYEPQSQRRSGLHATLQQVRHLKCEFTKCSFHLSAHPVLPLTKKKKKLMFLFQTSLYGHLLAAAVCGLNASLLQSKLLSLEVGCLVGKCL